MFAPTSTPRFGEPWAPDQTTATSGLVGCLHLQNVTEVVKVIIGKDDTKTIWLLHQTLFENNSTLARTHLQTPSEDDKDDKKVIRLPNEDPKTFREFVKFLYAGRITISGLEDLVRMYALGRRLHAAKFMEVCSNSAALFEDHKCSAETIKHAFDSTVEGDIFRIFMMKHIGRGVLAGKYSWKTEHDKKLLNPIMGDLMESVTDAIAEQRSAFRETATSSSFGAFGQARPPPVQSEAFFRPAVGFDNSSTSSLNATIAPSVGTAEPKYLPIQEREGTGNIQYQSISVMPAYNKYSAEELRLADYTCGRRHGQGEPTKTDGSFGSNRQGAFARYSFGPKTQGECACNGFGCNTSRCNKHGASSSNTQTGFIPNPFGSHVPTTHGCFGSFGSFGSNNTNRSVFGGNNTSAANVTNRSIFGSSNTITTNVGGGQSQSVFGAPPADPTATQRANLFAQSNIQRSGNVFGNSGAPQSGDFFPTQSIPPRAPSRPSVFGAPEQRNDKSGGLFGQSVASIPGSHTSLPQGHGISCSFGSLSLRQQASKCDCGYVATSEQIQTAVHNENENTSTPKERVVTSHRIQPIKSAKAEAVLVQLISSTKDEQHSPAPASTTARASEIAKVPEALGTPETSHLLNQAPLNPSISRFSFADVDFDDDEEESFTKVSPPTAEEGDL